MTGCAIVGVGARGASFARRLAAMPEVDLRWLVDASADRLATSLAKIAPAAPRATRALAAALDDPGVEAVFVTVPDHLHAPVAIAALKAGKHVFLEKPLATTCADAAAIIEAWRVSGRCLRLGYVLRDAAFFREIRQIVRAGSLGRIQSIRLTDDLSLVHGASYMRRWHRSSAHSGGLLVHKGCHDLDMVCWLLDTQPVRIASFGGRELFDRPAPAGHCSVCPERGACPYADTGAYEARTPAEAADPTAFDLDRCVYGAQIVDNQIVAFELAGGARGTYALAMRNPGRSERRIAILGERGRLDGVFERGVYDLAIDGRPARRREPAAGEGAGHGGGDAGALNGFLDACRDGRRWSPAEAAESLRGLVFALAAEQARRAGAVVSVTPGLAILTTGPVEAHLGP